jgi:hypothetical protein
MFEHFSKILRPRDKGAVHILIKDYQCTCSLYDNPFLLLEFLDEGIIISVAWPSVTTLFSSSRELTKHSVIVDFGGAHQYSFPYAQPESIENAEFVMNEAINIVKSSMQAQGNLVKFDKKKSSTPLHVLINQKRIRNESRSRSV